MSDVRPPSVVRCQGRSAFGECPAPPLYRTTHTNGKNPMHACGRHIAWLIRYRTVPGRSLVVTQLPTDDRASQETGESRG